MLIRFGKTPTLAEIFITIFKQKNELKLFQR